LCPHDRFITSKPITYSAAGKPQELIVDEVRPLPLPVPRSFSPQGQWSGRWKAGEGIDEAIVQGLEDNDRAESAMAARTVASKLAITRSSRVALLSGAIGIAAAGLIASPHILDAQLLAKKKPTHSVAAEPAPHFAGFAELVRAVKPAVIAVLARTTEADFASPAQGSPEGQRSRFSLSQGSGFFITSDGYAVTSNHVVKGSVSVEIHTVDGEIYKARVVGTDAASDLAVIKVDARRNFLPVKFAEQPPQVGDWIIAVGNPFGLGGTVTAGIVSARGRDVERESDSYQDLLQIDAPINKGNSGGPTFDIAGNVVGVNTIILSPTGGSVGIAFAIPSDKAKVISEQLKERGAVTRGWLGIQFQSVLPEIADSLELAEPAGILIADVQPAGPAAKAGIAAGDLIDSVNGEAIKNAHDFSRAIDAIPPHSTVILGVRKKGREEWIAVTVGGYPAQPDVQPLPPPKDEGVNEDHPQLGLKLLALGASNGTGEHRGVMVMEVEPGGLAAGRGIDPGDLILDIAEQAIATPEDVDRVVNTARNAGKRSVLMRIRSGDTAKFIALPIG
jgi:serine protease Do